MNAYKGWLRIKVKSAVFDFLENVTQFLAFDVVQQKMLLFVRS